MCMKARLAIADSKEYIRRHVDRDTAFRKIREFRARDKTYSAHISLRLNSVNLNKGYHSRLESIIS